MKRILIIRSGSTKCLFAAIESVKGLFPDSRISVLTDPDISQTLSQNLLVDEVILYGNLGAFFRHQLRQLWSDKYDIKVALFTGEDEGRYNKFKVLAHLLPPLHWMLVYDEKGNDFYWPTDWRRALAHLWWRAQRQRILPRLGGFFMRLIFFPLAVVLLFLSVGCLMCKRCYYSRRPRQTKEEAPD